MTAPEWVLKPHSHVVGALRYWPDNQILDIVYNSGTGYRYYNVTQAEWIAVNTAQSTGQAVDQFIKKPRKVFHKLQDETEA